MNLAVKLLIVLTSLKESTSLSVMFEIFGYFGSRLLFQLRVGLSPLKAHKFRHNFSDTTNDICDCSTGCETTKHFLLECPLHRATRRILFNSINPILLSYDLVNISNDQMVSLLLYGHVSLKSVENQIVLKSTIAYLKSSDRF